MNLSLTVLFSNSENVSDRSYNLKCENNSSNCIGLRGEVEYDLIKSSDKGHNLLLQEGSSNVFYSIVPKNSSLSTGNETIVHFTKGKTPSFEEAHYTSFLDLCPVIKEVSLNFQSNNYCYDG